MATSFAPVQACIFDMDGLLIDSERIYTVVSNKVLAPYGKELTWDIKAQLMGRPGLDSATHLVRLTGIPVEPQDFLEMMNKELPLAFAEVQPLPGALKLIEHLVKHKVPIVIATGSRRAMFEVKKGHLEHLFSPFGDLVVCGDDPRLEGKGKPDPTIFQLAARELGFHSAEEHARCLVFEDGAPGVIAGKAAGMQVVWVPDAELVKALGKEAGLAPTVELASLEDFKPEAFGLPPY